MKKDKATGGIRLRIMNYVTGGITLVIAFLMLATTFLAIADYNSLRHTSEAFVECLDGAEQIQDASDYLTEHVRYFVGSGMREYLDLYFEEAKVTRRREEGLSKLGKHFAGTELYDALERAFEESYALMKIEYHAMRLRLESIHADLSDYPAEVRDWPLSAEELGWDEETQIDQSRKLVYEEQEYGIYKDEITGQVNRCLEGLENTLQERQAKKAGQLRALVILEQILIILMISAVGLLVILTSVNVFHPLIRAEQLIRKEEPIPVEKGSYEYRFFAATYNRMFEANKENRERLAFKASHDYLTGIFNRSGLDRYLDRAAEGQNALVLVDLDGFKGVNDTYGHDGGDKILRKLSEKLSASFRSDDRICRIGGDEFAVIMWNAGVECGAMIREKIASVNAEMRISSEDVPSVTISVGVAFGGESDLTGRDLFRYADRELYRVKRSGGCGISIRDGSQDEGDNRDGLPEDEIEK